MLLHLTSKVEGHLELLSLAEDLFYKQNNSARRRNKSWHNTRRKSTLRPHFEKEEAHKAKFEKPDAKKMTSELTSPGTYMSDCHWDFI